MGILSSIANIFRAPTYDDYDYDYRDRIPASVERYVRARDGRVCQVCGNRIRRDQKIEIHHWKAARLGGPSLEYNLAVTHAICNGRVGVRGREEACRLARTHYEEWCTEALIRRIERMSGIPETRFGRKARESAAERRQREALVNPAGARTRSKTRRRPRKK